MLSHMPRLTPDVLQSLQCSLRHLTMQVPPESVPVTTLSPPPDGLKLEFSGVQ